MKRVRNVKFDFATATARSEFGGSLLKNSHAKDRRPFSTKRSMHLVLRSSLAKGEFSLRAPQNLKRVKEIIYAQALKTNTRVYRFANSGNHLHLLILVRSSKALACFLRSVSGLIARLVMRSERGSALPKGVRFWDQRPFSRIVSWGKEYVGVARYLLQNTLEALGFIPYQSRGSKPQPLVRMVT